LLSIKATLQAFLSAHFSSFTTPVSVGSAKVVTFYLLSKF
jgi:hypothetical protein